jgi:VanZ family protein
MRANSSYPQAIVTAGLAVIIAYGSLYPFEFSLPKAGPGPVQALLRTWANTPGRGDFLANVLLYIPLGFFAVLTPGQRYTAIYRCLGALLLGILLSISMELAQYYDVGRDTQATDIYANVAGTVLGATFGVVVGGSFRWPLVDQIAANRVPALILSAWVAYRLYPFVPTIDLHKYWDTLKPVILTPNLSAYDLFRHSAIWLIVYALVAKIGGAALSPWLLLPLFAGAVLFSKILIITTTLSLAELAGAIVAYVIWAMFRRSQRAYLVIAIAMFSATVVAQRLEPFQFTAQSVPFGWIPFRSFMHGSVEIDVLAFLEKFFHYGGWIWLLMEARVSRRAAAALVAGILFATSVAETYLPHRSGEVTDAVMALAIAGVFALMNNEDEAANSQPDLRGSYSTRSRRGA